MIPEALPVIGRDVPSSQVDDRPVSYGRPGLLAAAVLVFLAAATRAGVVAANFGPRADWFGAFDGGHGFADDIARPGRGRTVGVGARGRSAESRGALVQGF